MTADVSVKVPERVVAGLADGRIGAFLVTAEGRDWLAAGGDKAYVWLRTSRSRLKVRVLGSKIVRRLDLLPSIAGQLGLEIQDFTGSRSDEWQAVGDLAGSSGAQPPYLLVRAVPVGEITIKKAPVPDDVTVITGNKPAAGYYFALHQSSLATYENRLHHTIDRLGLPADAQHGAHAVAVALAEAGTCWIGENTRKRANRKAGADQVRAAIQHLIDAGVLVEPDHGGPGVCRPVLNGLWATHVRVLNQPTKGTTPNPPSEPPAGTWVFRWDTPLDDQHVHVHAADEDVYRQRLLDAVNAVGLSTRLQTPAEDLAAHIAQTRRPMINKNALRHTRRQHGQKRTNSAVAELRKHQILATCRDSVVVSRAIVDGLRMGARPKGKERLPNPNGRPTRPQVPKKQREQFPSTRKGGLTWTLADSRRPGEPT